MFKRNLFESAMARKGKTLGDIATALGLNRCTIYKKVSQKSDFTREEVQKIKEYLDIPVEEMNAIFFAEEVA